MVVAPLEHTASFSVAQPLTDAILQKSAIYSYEIWSDQFSAKSQVTSRKEYFTNALAEVTNNLSQSAIDLAREKSASSWLTALPFGEHGFCLHKGAAISLRYDWLLCHLPSNCACGASLSVEHALYCPKGSFPSLRHNEVRDFTATYEEVCIEPELQPLTGETRLPTPMTMPASKWSMGGWGGGGGSYE